MIAEFQFKNFYSIKSEQRLSFEPTADNFQCDEYCIEVKEGVRLLKIGTIYGANASGKTNILIAISFFRDLMVDVPKNKTEKIEFFPFLLDSNSRNEKTEMAMSFYLNKERYSLTVVFDQHKIYSEKLDVYPGTQPATLYLRTYNTETDSAEIKFGGKLGIGKKSQLAITGNTINNCTVLAAFGKSNVESSRLNSVYDFFANSIDILRPHLSLTTYTKNYLDKDKGGELKSFLIDFLKASDFNISNLELREEEVPITPEMEKIIQSAPIPDEVKEQMLKREKITNAELLFSHQTDNGEFVLPEKIESRGTIRFMGMAVLLKQLLQENKIICIDEVETSLHYELLSYFIKVFLSNSERGSQLILTTHDINLLDEDFIRRDTIWFTDKDSCGETKLTRLSSLGLHKNLSPYNAYKQGKLVKLPFLESIYLNTEDQCNEE
jgi:AAA15 family ATPase/GTPase